MKKENLIFAIGAVIVLIAAGMKLLELPYAAMGGIVSKVMIVVMTIYLVLKNNTLKKKIKHLEANQ